ncbi:antifreeze protein [Szabonella alba]|uniref:Antifreeze protein n=1 Tax=Szabonella alba TaxID=2804194 RepID=A0A8K0Y0G8_9RHOB|nr:antifreeze protein [Szabonella alba]MBL4917103.1 antifreeze protein [Szabonella alba]
MFPPIFPVDAFRLGYQMSMLALEAQSVVAMRLWGMAGLWNVTPSENSRMVSEKSTAMIASGMAAQRAMASGASATETVLAAIKPIRRRTGLNARRLSRRGAFKT